jgi:hypothetical protein
MKKSIENLLVIWLPMFLGGVFGLFFPRYICYRLDKKKKKEENELNKIINSL